VLGLVLLHKGARRIFSGKPPRDSRREWLTDAVVSLVYTGVIVALIKLEILKPFAGYFKSN
jgi:hypothetical protein